MLERLKELVELDAPSGFEDDVRDYLKSKLEKKLECKVDKIGNLIARKNKAKGPKILVCAHMDEVGFIVQSIDEKGFIKLAPIGGWDDRILLGMPVKILAKEKIIGVFSTTPPHVLKPEETNRVVKIEECYVDTGLGRRELEQLGVKIGTFATPYSNFINRNQIIMAKALDDRIGCLLLLEIAELADSFDFDLIIGATVQEEVGTRGAKVLANETEPDFALILECTVAADIPGVEESRQPTKLDEGVALTLIDKTMISRKDVFDKALKIAQEEGIKHQIKKPIYGGTDAGAIHLASRGIPSLVISCPARYIHSSYSLTKLNNIEETKKLAMKILENIQIFLE